MSDLALDPVTGDLLIEAGEAQLIDGIDSIRQHLLCRLRTTRGEWKQDRRVGVPYLEDVFDKPSASVLRAIFERVILETPGIKSIQSLTFDVDAATRELAVSAEAISESGEPIVLARELVL